MRQNLSSLTVVVVVNGTVPNVNQFDALATVLEAEKVMDFDIILVANTVDAAVALQLKEIVARTPDTTVIFLNHQLHNDVARLIGINHAVGDFILFSSVTEEEIGALPAMLTPLRQGYDLVVADPSEGKFAVMRPVTSKIMLGAYFLLYRFFTKIELEDSPTGFRILARAAALFIAGQPAAELMLRSRNIGPGFPAAILPVLKSRVLVQRQTSLRRSWSAGIRMLLSTTTAPLRAATYLGLFGGILSLAHGVYVISIYTFKEDVVPGWTTISLQLAAMMFIFSVSFMLLSEYVVQIHAANSPRSLRHFVLRELRSPLSRRSGRLNVVDAHGAFQLGTPPEMLTIPTQVNR